MPSEELEELKSRKSRTRKRMEGVGTLLHWSDVLCRQEIYIFFVITNSLTWIQNMWGKNCFSCAYMSQKTQILIAEESSSSCLAVLR